MLNRHRAKDAADACAISGLNSARVGQSKAKTVDTKNLPFLFATMLGIMEESSVILGFF